VRLGLMVLVVLLTVLAFQNLSHAQAKKAAEGKAPTLLLVSPPGGQAGTTVTLLLSGRDLDEPEGLLCSIPGAKAEYLSAAEAPKGETKKGGRRGMAAGPMTAVRFKLTLPVGTPPGIHDVRVVTARGVSNPRAFVVSDMTELQEKEPNNDVGQAQRVPLNCVV